MREPQHDASYADPSTTSVCALFPELFAADATGWLVMMSHHGEPMSALVSADVARFGLGSAGVSDVAGDLPSSVTWPDLCREALVRRVIYLTHQGRVAAAVVPYDVASVGQRLVREPSPPPAQN